MLCQRIRRAGSSKPCSSPGGRLAVPPGTRRAPGPPRTCGLTATLAAPLRLPPLPIGSELAPAPLDALTAAPEAGHQLSVPVGWATPSLQRRLAALGPPGGLAGSAPGMQPVAGGSVAAERRPGFRPSATRAATSRGGAHAPSSLRPGRAGRGQAGAAGVPKDAGGLREASTRGEGGIA